MKAVVYYDTEDVRVEEVPDPKIQEPTDCIIKITKTALCGSDLHLYNGFNPAMKKGDILGHEFMGEVIEVGSEVQRIKVGDRIIVPFTIAEGKCWYCEHNFWSLCQHTNPNKEAQEKLYGYTGSALYGYSHLYGGIPGGQAEMARVIMADVNAFKVPESLTDEQALFTTDILSTGYMAAENANVQPGDTVAIWGAGPIGLFSMKSAQLMRANKIIMIDYIPERLALAATQGAEIINFKTDTAERDVVQQLKDMSGGRGPDAVIDAVGLEAHTTGVENLYDKAKQLAFLQTDRPGALREAIQAARPGTTVSIPGVYMGMADTFPIGVAFAKGLTMKMGQTHVHNYVERLFETIQKGELDPTFLITHRLPLSDAAEAYKMFRDKTDGCIKVVFTP